MKSSRVDGRSKGLNFSPNSVLIYLQGAHEANGGLGTAQCGLFFISFGFTKPTAALCETESVPETLEKFHTLAQLSEREGFIEICLCVFGLISICF
jgi:hypothetical protein